MGEIWLVVVGEKNEVLSRHDIHGVKDGPAEMVGSRQAPPWM